MAKKKKGYIGWIVSRLIGGKREFIFCTLSKYQSDAIQNYLDWGTGHQPTWAEDRNRKVVQARVHKVTEIKTIK